MFLTLTIQFLIMILNSLLLLFCSINLYELIKKNNYQGFSIHLVRRFAYSILQCMRVMFKENIIHCDMKPENILLRQKGSSAIKVIDFGSGCFESQRSERPEIFLIQFLRKKTYLNWLLFLILLFSLHIYSKSLLQGTWNYIGNPLYNFYRHGMF